MNQPSFRRTTERQRSSVLWLAAFTAITLRVATSSLAQSPPFAFTQSTDPITSTNATLNGMVTPNGLPTTAWFEWGRTIGYGNRTVSIAVGDGNAPVQVSGLLSNLASGVVYHCRLVASNSAGVTSGDNHLFWSIGLFLNGPSPYKPELQAPFVDPGVGAMPLAMITGSSFSAILKGDGGMTGWGSAAAWVTNPPAAATNLVAIAGTLGLRADGRVLQLATGLTVPDSASNCVAVAAGGNHGMALRTDGTILGWGNNTGGQINIPTEATNIISIAAGGDHSMALRVDGRVFAWGKNIYSADSGQTNVPPDVTNAVAIAVGAFHDLALRADGTVVAWGSNSDGRTNVPVSATNVVAIAAGNYHSLALKADGTVVFWGRTNYQTIPGTATNLVAIATGGGANLGLRADGSFVNWGDLYFYYGATNIPGNLTTLSLPVATNSNVDVNVLGEYLVSYSVTNSIGAVSTVSRTVMVVPERPAAVVLSPTNVVNANATLKGSVNPKTVDSIAWFEWGTTTSYGSKSASFNLGNGISPVPISAEINGLIPGLTYHWRIVASNSYSTVHSGDALFWIPAINFNGANPLTNECHAPVLESATVNALPLAVAEKSGVCFVVRADRTVFGWSLSGSTNNSALSTMPADLTNVTAIAVGGNLINSSYGSFALALKGDGSVEAWGTNHVGQTDVPPAATSVVQISAGDGHALALRSDGSIVGWGLNNFGQATAPASATNMVAIAAGGFHSLALRANGTIVSWGLNSYGQTNVPTSATNVAAIAAGFLHNLIARSNGSVVAWGYNNGGQSTVPASATNVTAVAADSHNVTLKSNGTVLAWANNASGGATNVASIARNVVMTKNGLILRINGSPTYVPAGISNLNLTATTSGFVDYSTPGEYFLTYAATNVDGAVGSAIRTVVVADTLPPSVSLIGANPIILEVGSAFSDPGTVASDLCGGDLSGGVATSGSVNTNIPGNYLLTYSVADPVGLTALTNRTVFVVKRPELAGTTQLVDGSFQFSFTNTPGAPFRVQTSTNLSMPIDGWIPLGSADEGPPGVFNFTDTTATNWPLRFYRVTCP